MRLNAHLDMLPERAFQKRGFGGAPATLEGGKGGGSAAPSVTKSETSNIPEYAKPYVMNMLGAAQNQLFDTAAGGTDIWGNPTPGAITGFKPYQPYSTNPQDYFAGPSSLQTSAYNAAGQLRSPVQYQTGSQLATQAGLGQLGTVGQAGMYGQQGANIGQLGLMGAMPAFGAGQQYAGQVTSPGAVSSYMSPYQQAVTDVAKNAAIREAQLADQQVNLGAARQGTYGGARQALAKAERERNLLSNLSNIQAQGSQSAYDRAIQNMQYGANLGLQGIQTGLQGIGQGLAGTAQGLQGVGAQQAGYAGAGQAGATLGQLGSAQNAADIANINLQNQLGGQQQQYQQNIINQAIQDYATAQQYPYMQLSMMSNLLRGLPMQSMTTQSYQAQPGLAQQGLGLLGAYGAYKGAFKEGGEVKTYLGGGGVRASLENKIDDIANTGGVKGLQSLLAQTKSPQAKEMIMERMREEGIAGAPTGKLGTNMAGGGIIAFSNEGAVEDPNVEELTEEEKQALKDNPYLQRSRAVKEALAPLGQLKNYDPVQKIAELGGMARRGWTNFITESDVDQAARFRKASARKEQADSPKEYVPPVKTATQREEAAKAADEKEYADASGQSSKIDYDKAAQYLQASKKDVKAADKEEAGGRPPYGVKNTMTGIEDAFGTVQKMLGTDKPNEQLQAYEDLIAGKQQGIGVRAEQMDRNAMALGFLKMAQNPRGITAGALDGFESYLTSSAANKKEMDKIELDFAKARADISKARREEAKGNFELAEKLYDNTQKRLSERMQATKPGEFEKMFSAFKNDPAAFENFRRAYSGADEDLVRLTKADAAVKAIKENPTYMQLAMSKKPEDKEKAARMIADTYRRYQIDPDTGMPMGSSQTASAGGGNRLKFDATGKQI